VKPWNERPFEVRNLFNPAFCGLLLARSLHGFEEENPDGMPFSLTLLVLPLCLHKASREIIADNPRSYLIKTVETNPQMLVGFADRVTSLLGFSFEALGLLMAGGCFDVSKSGRLQPVPHRVRKTLNGTPESVSCQRVARIVGKEFARIADRVTVYTTFGIRP
jgi:Family of unknown function (DUF6521)